MIVKVIHDWRAKHFGLRPAPDRIVGRSDAMQEAIDQEQQRLEREEQRAAACRAHVRDLGEQERIEVWREDVERFGADTVETIMRHAEPGFQLPAALREPRPEEKR